MTTQTTDPALAARHTAARRLLERWAVQTSDPAETTALRYLGEALDADEIRIAPADLPPADSLRGAYLATALAQAVFKWEPDDQRFFGSIPACPGAWAYEPTVETCRTELAAVLNDWLSAGLAAGDPVPVIAGIDLNPRRGS